MRGLVGAVLFAFIMFDAPSVAAQKTSIAIGLVSRDSVLRDAQAVQALRAREAVLTQALQSTIDDLKADLAREEEELAAIKPDLEPAEFEARARDFDRRVRAARQAAQERVTLLRRIVQQARTSLVAALPGVLERLRIDRGLDLILDTGSVLAAGTELVLTEHAVSLYDRMVSPPEIPDINVTAPLVVGPTADAPRE